MGMGSAVAKMPRCPDAEPLACRTPAGGGVCELTDCLESPHCVSKTGKAHGRRKKKKKREDQKRRKKKEEVSIPRPST